MTNRDAQKAEFLCQAGWADALTLPLASDASARRYQRLIRPDGDISTVIMDAPPETAGSMRSFVEVAEYLNQTGLSAPNVVAQDLKLGFLLIEDLGDALFSDVITKDPGLEPQLYEAAIDVIVHLHQHPNTRLPIYAATQMANATDLAFLHYQEVPVANLDHHAKRIIAELKGRLAHLSSFSSVSLRDYHADNLIWLPERRDLRRVGLLDFQDAVQTHPSYDLMSLIRDARRDVSDELSEHLISRFCHNAGYDESSFRSEAALISAQRNIRILGIFARLSRVQGKPHYVDLIPRVWANLQKDLAHPSLADLRIELSKILPHSTPEFLAMLREPCPIQP